MISRQKIRLNRNYFYSLRKGVVLREFERIFVIFFPFFFNLNSTFHEYTWKIQKKTLQKLLAPSKLILEASMEKK